MYVAATNNIAIGLLGDAEKAAGQILDSTFDSITDANQRARTLALAKQLHYLLANLTEGPAKTIVRNNTLNIGLETWRRLCNKFALPGATRHIGLLSTILAFSFGSNWESDFDRWEALKQKYEISTASTLPDSVLIALLLSKTSGSLQEHLRLQLSSLDTYEKFRQVLVNYFRSTHVLNQTTFNDDPMDIGSINFDDCWYWDDNFGWSYSENTVNAFWRKLKGKGKGKRRGKGKGKGNFTKGKSGKGKGSGGHANFNKGKGKGKGTFSGVQNNFLKCWNCGGNHKRRDCPQVLSSTNRINALIESGTLSADDLWNLYPDEEDFWEDDQSW